MPSTFLERGVVVPFTTPVLVGTRARPNDRCGMELLVPNLSGGRGVYVLPWTGITQLCRPTVHDRRLNQKVESLLTVTPASIRDAARDVALEGLAGRDAQLAAARSADRDHRARIRANFLLLVALLERMNPHGSLPANPARAAAHLEARAYETIADCAARFGLAADSVTSDLEQLAEVFTPVGVSGQTQHARLVSLLEALSGFRHETAAWAREHRSADGELAAMIADAAAATITCAASTLRDARALTEDVVSLIRRWNANPAGVLRLAARPEWLLDGWEQICLLWSDAVMPGARKAALMEIGTLVPVLPRQVQEWAKLPPQHAGMLTYRRTVVAREDWRSGAFPIDLVARNERLRARSA